MKIWNWINARLPIRSFFQKNFTEYYVPKNLNFLYIFGVLALILLINQLISGLWLTMFYIPTAKEAFDSIEFLMREVQFGWLFRYMHSTGASLFFIVLYLHIFKALLYGSYQRPRELVWFLGVCLWILFLVEAFLGYVLPWGQMSYWAAQVITALVQAIPYVGESLGLWLRGGYEVDTPLLQRFFALHIIAIPFMVFFLVYLHIVALRVVGSNNPQGMNRDKEGWNLDFVPFHPYYLVKDSFAVLIFLGVFFAIVFFIPDMGGFFLESNNFVKANPLETPFNITPIWYMAPFYAIIKIIPHKVLGIVLTMAAVLMFFLLPFLDKSAVRSMRYKGVWSRFFLIFFIISFMVLMYVGLTPTTPIKLLVARAALITYFSYFLCMPFYTRYEKTRPLPPDLGGRVEA